MLWKTGTAQNPHGEDHSTIGRFMKNPKIALAVYVENGGGALHVVPIASLMIEKYLKGTIKRDI